MKLGFSLPTAGPGTPQNQLRIARRAEALGYHSLWVFQRLLYALAAAAASGSSPSLKARSGGCFGARSTRSARTFGATPADEGLTELFLDGNFDPDGATIERALEVMEALAPARSIS